MLAYAGISEVKARVPEVVGKLTATILSRKPLAYNLTPAVVPFFIISLPSLVPPIERLDRAGPKLYDISVSKTFVEAELESVLNTG